MVSVITFLFPWGENGIAPHQEHLKAGSSDAISPHSLTLFPYRQEWKDKGQDGEWLEGGRLILQPVSNYIVIARMHGFCSWAVLFKIDF